MSSVLGRERGVQEAIKLQILLDISRSTSASQLPNCRNANPIQMHVEAALPTRIAVSIIF